MDNNEVIEALTLQGTSLIKLYKFLPKSCIKASPEKSSDIKKHELQINIGGINFTGTDDNSNIVIKSIKRTYTKEELMELQNLAAKCYTYPFGGFEFTFTLNVISSEEEKGKFNTLINKHKIEHAELSWDSNGPVMINIRDVKDFSKPSFIDFILELQTLPCSIKK